MLPRDIRTACGFTLVETLVATALVVVAAAGLAQLVAVGNRQSARTRDAFEALAAAQARLEALRAIPWSHADPATGAALAPGGSLSTDTPGYVERAARLLVRWEIQRVDPLDGNVLALRVCAFDPAAPSAPEACVLSIRGRRP
jgi:prepilin-type N-terminal cleavage/methylation domain-containing protein